MITPTPFPSALRDAAERVSRLAEEIQSARRANRELVENLVRSEVSRLADRLGFVARSEVDALRLEVADLRARVDRLTTVEAPATDATEAMNDPTRSDPTP